MTASGEDNKTVAHAAARAFGGKPQVVRFWDDDRRSSIDILSCADRPQIGTNSYATIGLSGYPIGRGDVRAEIVGTCGSSFSRLDNALATAAFCVINSGWQCYPGATFPNVLKEYEVSSTMEHFLFVPPFLWEDNLVTLGLETKRVAWLLAVPVSEAELQYAESHGSEQLERMFIDEQIDIYDLNRPSVL